MGKKTEFKNIYYMVIAIVICFLSTRVSLGEISGDGSSPNVTACQEGSCLSQGHPCACYTDGWIACESRNLTRILQLPKCARMIRLHNNGITEIGQHDFTELTDVELIDLSNNQITELRSGIFEHLTALRDLLFHRNWIVSINSCAFHGLVQLSALDLSYNQITSLPPNVFDENPRLRELSLYSNNISDLQARWFHDKTQLNIVVLYNNPWNCTCKLWESYKYIITNNTLDLQCDDGVGGLLSSMCILCDAPLVIKNTVLGNLTADNFTDCDQDSLNYTDDSNESYKCAVSNHTFSKVTSVTRNSTMAVSTATTSLLSIQSTSASATNYSVSTITGTAEAEMHTIEWWVVVLLAVVTLSLLGMLGLAMWCGKKKDKNLTRRRSQQSHGSGQYEI